MDKTAAPPGVNPGAMETRFARVKPTSYDKKNRTVEAVLSTGAVVKRWWGQEELRITPEAVNLERVALGQVRFLDHHNSYRREAVLGTLTEARIESGALVGTIALADTEEGRSAEGQIARGELTGISVGYRADAFERVSIVENVETWAVTRWELYEVSLVSVPADPKAGIRSADPGHSPEPQRNPPMDKTITEPSGGQPETRAANPAAANPAPAAPAAPAPAASPSAEQLLRAERQRNSDILALQTRHALPNDLVARAIGDGVTIEAFRAQVLDHLATRTAAPNPVATIQRDETETRRIALTDALTHRFAARGGGKRPDVHEAAKPYLSHRIAELAAECLGDRRPPRSAAEVDDVMQRAFHTTSDFPGIFGDAMRRRLLAAYQPVMPTYRALAARRDFDDFRVHNVVRAGDFPALQPIAEGGEIKYGTFGESKETAQVLSYAVAFSVTRQMIVNDDLSAIDQISSGSGRRINDLENGLFFTLLLSASGAGPTLATDATAMFHANHANLAGSGGAIGLATLSAGREAMRKQKGIPSKAGATDALTLNIAPSILLVGPAKETEAGQIVAPLMPAQTSNVVPRDLVSNLAIVVDAYITGNAWYLFADPSNVPNFIWGFLAGYEAPRLRVEEPFGRQGIGISIEHDFGVAGIDFRGAYRNPGA